MRMTHSKFCDELLVMMRRDRHMRIAASYRRKPWDWTVDRDHTRRMKVLVRAHGWPTFTMVGKRGAGAAWMLVQHADHDVRWQKRCLAWIRAAVRSGQASSEHLAYLVDRVFVNTDKRQMYGTQWYINTRGVFGPRPIRDRKRLGARRRAMGLGSFTAYAKQMRAMQRRVKPGPPSSPPKDMRIPKAYRVPKH